MLQRKLDYLQKIKIEKQSLENGLFVCNLRNRNDFLSKFQFCNVSDFQVPFNKNSYEGTSSKEKLLNKHTQAACELEPSNLIAD